MQYESVTPSSNARLTTNQNFKPNEDILSVRRKLGILLAIKLLFSIAYFATKVYYLIDYTRLPFGLRHTEVFGALITGVIVAIISLIYLIIYTIVVHKYIRLGILIFACLAVLELVCVIIIVILSIIAIVTTKSAVYAVAVGIVLSIIIVIVTIILSILTFLTIFYSFKLAELIKIQQGYLRL